VTNINPANQPDMIIEAGLLPEQEVGATLCGVWIRHARDPDAAAHAIALLTDIKHELMERGYRVCTNPKAKNYVADEDGERVLRQYDGTATALVVGTDEFEVDGDIFADDMKSVARALNR
jgi:hypothetical protein